MSDYSNYENHSNCISSRKNVNPFGFSASLAAQQNHLLRMLAAGDCIAITTTTKPV